MVAFALSARDALVSAAVVTSPNARRGSGARGALRPRSVRARAAAPPAATPRASSAISLADEVRGDFPILDQRLPDSGKRLVYLDSAASSQKPSRVIDAHSVSYTHLTLPTTPYV